MNIEIDDMVAAELAYMVRLNQEFGAPVPLCDVQGLVHHVLDAIATGSRRPGSWERGLLDSLGLVADTGLHHYYRSEYGDPFPPRIVSADMDLQVIMDHFDWHYEDHARGILRLLLEVYRWDGRDLHAMSSTTCGHIIDQVCEIADGEWDGDQ